MHLGGEPSGPPSTQWSKLTSLSLGPRRDVLRAQRHFWAVPAPNAEPGSDSEETSDRPRQECVETHADVLRHHMLLRLRNPCDRVLPCPPHAPLARFTGESCSLRLLVETRRQSFSKCPLFLMATSLLFLVQHKQPPWASVWFPRGPAERQGAPAPACNLSQLHLPGAKPNPCAGPHGEAAHTSSAAGARGAGPFCSHIWQRGWPAPEGVSLGCATGLQVGFGPGRVFGDRCLRTRPWLQGPPSGTVGGQRADPSLNCTCLLPFLPHSVRLQCRGC